MPYHQISSIAVIIFGLLFRFALPSSLAKVLDNVTLSTIRADVTGLIPMLDSGMEKKIMYYINSSFGDSF